MKYIWLKDGKPWKDTSDIEGEKIIREHFAGGISREIKRHNRGTSYEEVMETWFKDNEMHRDDDKPAYINTRGGNLAQAEWYQNGKLKRDNDKPTMINYNRISGEPLIEYWHNDLGEVHRDDNKPAKISYMAQDGKPTRKEWFKNGRFVRAWDREHDGINW